MDEDKQFPIKADDFHGVPPIRQHKMAYEVWRNRDEPDVDEIRDILCVDQKSFANTIKLWKEGTLSCSCEYHSWEMKKIDEQRDKQAGAESAVVDLADVAEDGSPKKIQQYGEEGGSGEVPAKTSSGEEIDFSLHDDLIRIQMALKGLESYIMGKTLYEKDGTPVKIPRLQPRNMKELVNAIEKFVKLKLSILGEPDSRVEVTHHSDDRPIIELPESDYAAKHVAQTEELQQLLEDFEEGGSS